jgi:protein-S-isoprenylcysteine O-methyltransferase Ste14
MRTLFIALRAVLWGAVFFLLWAALAAAVRPFDARLPFGIPEGLAPVGWALALAGGALVLACVGTFVGIGRGTAAPFDPPRVFVASGPYRFVRNPMYLGAAALLAGYGILEKSPAIALLAVGLLLAAHLFVVLIEEPGLGQRFGASYREYKSSVRRWLPRAPARPS